jgi:hypothetical protein
LSWIKCLVAELLCSTPGRAVNRGGAGHRVTEKPRIGTTLRWLCGSWLAGPGFFRHTTPRSEKGMATVLSRAVGFASGYALTYMEGVI